MRVLGRHGRPVSLALLLFGIVAGSLMVASAAGEAPRGSDRPAGRDRTAGGDDAQRLVVTGDASSVVRPGGPERAIDLMIQNPFPFPVTLTGVDIAVDRVTTRVGCDGRTNLVVGRSFSGTALIPARSSRTLSSLAPAVTPMQWPTVRMPDLPVSQDRCRGARFTLHYAASFVK
jgi:hypothetical protein